MKYLLIVMAVAITGCGYSARQSEMIGQPKKVMHNTPLLCRPFDDVDLSLGVVRHGIGSMSTQDKWLYVPNPEQYKIIQKASATGAIVKVTYDSVRFSWCTEGDTVTDVEVMK